MGLLRDVPFAKFETNALAKRAAAELSKLSDYRAPRQDGKVTPAVLFRGDTRGDVRGPYVSQFLFRDIQYGTLLIPQLHDTVQRDQDFMTDFDSWLAVQRGVSVPPIDRDPPTAGTCRRRATWRTTCTSTRCTRHTSTPR